MANKKVGIFEIWKRKELQKERLRRQTAARYGYLLKAFEHVAQKHLASTSYYWMDYAERLQCSLRISVASMGDLLPMIEEVDELLDGVECISLDSTEGTRQFIWDFEGAIQLAIYAEPDTTLQAAEGRRCRKVIVGTDTHSYTSNRYAIICD